MFSVLVLHLNLCSSDLFQLRDVCRFLDTFDACGTKFFPFVIFGEIFSTLLFPIFIEFTKLQNHLNECTVDIFF